MDNESRSNAGGDDGAILQGVKKAYRPDWLDDANRIFINKLNDVCSTYQDVYQDVKYLKSKVAKEQKNDLDELKLKVRELTDGQSLMKSKMDNLEQNMSTAVREMVQYYFDQRVESRLEQFVTVDLLAEKLKVKMDNAMFFEFQKKRLEAKSLDNREFKLAEKFHNMQRQIEGLIDQNYLHVELKKKASQDHYKDLRDTVNQLKQNYDSQSKQINSKLSQTNEELVTKTAELMQNMHELNDKVKTLEQEIDYGHSRSRHGRSRSETPVARREMSERSPSVRNEQHDQTAMEQQDQTNQNGTSIIQADEMFKDNDTAKQSRIPEEKEDSKKSLTLFNEQEKPDQEQLPFDKAPSAADIMTKSKAQSEKSSKKSKKQEEVGQLDDVQKETVLKTHQSVEDATQSKLISDAQNRTTPPSHQASQQIQVQARDSRLSNKDLDHLTEPKDIHQSQIGVEGHEKTVSSIENTAQEGGSKSLQQSQVDDVNQYKMSNIGILQEMDNESSQMAPQNTIQIDLDNIEKPVDTSVTRMMDPQPSPGSPMKSKGINPRGSIKQDELGGHGKSPRNPSINETASPTSKKRRDLRKDLKKFEMDAQSLAQNQEFINAQQQNQEQVARIDRRVDQMLDRLADFLHKIDRITIEVKRLSDQDQNMKLDKLQKRLVEGIVHEELLPMKRNLNVDLKRLRRHVEECMATTDDHQDRHNNVQQQLDLINVTILRQLKNTDNEKQLLDRELSRMQNIDRIKVHNARNSFFNPDTGSLLPTVDTLYAASGNQSPSVGENISFDFASTQPHSQSVTREIVTSNELRGQCERFGTKPSRRQRIIITRTQDPNNPRGFGSKRLHFTANNTHRSRFNGGNFAPNDSIISNTSHNQVERVNKTQGSIFADQNANFGVPMYGTIDIQGPQFPDATARLRMKLNKKHLDDVSRKRHLAQGVEDHRLQVLDKFNIKKSF